MTQPEMFSLIEYSLSLITQDTLENCYRRWLEFLAKGANGENL